MVISEMAVSETKMYAMSWVMCYIASGFALFSSIVTL